MAGTQEKAATVGAGAASTNHLHNQNSTSRGRVQTAPTIRYSRGATRYDNRPEQREAADFDAFTTEVLADRAEAKGMAYICAAFAEGSHSNPEKYPSIATWRLKHRVQPRAFLPFDIDEATRETDAGLLEHLARYKGFAYRTASHTPDKPRLRIMLAQTRATGREEGIALGMAAQAMIEQERGPGLKFDTSAYRGEQPLYAPPLGADVFRFDGQPVDVDAVLANVPVAPVSVNRLKRVETDDTVLRALNELGMVKANEGGGKFLIECPFADQHSMEGGDGETAYWLPHTGGFARGHFKCFHRCRERTDAEYLNAVLMRYQAKLGRPPPFVLAEEKKPGVPPKPAGQDELAWLLEHAPAVLRAYMGWYMRNAIRPHPVFALVSGLLFAQAVVGRSHALPRGLRPNLWILLLAPTESGKGDVPRLAQHALDALLAAEIFPAVPQFEAAFASVEGLWWHFETVPQVVLVDEELGKTLGAIIAAPEGTPRHAMRRGLLLLHDAAQRPTVAPLRYSQRTRSARVMLPLHYPWLSIVGTGVPRDIGSFAAAAGDDGLLNRFLPVVVEVLPVIGTIGNIEPPPPEVVKWAKSLRPKGVQEAMDHPASITVLTEHEDMGKDWAAEADYGAQLAQDLPGVYGRLAEKVLKAAMLFAVLDGTGRMTAAGFAWARRFVHWAAAGFAQHFENEGGGAENEMDGMSRAFMATFNAPALAGKETVSSREFGRYGGRAWRGCRDSHKRRRVIETLIDDGLVEEIDLLPKGKAYRKL